MTGLRSLLVITAFIMNCFHLHGQSTHRSTSVEDYVNLSNETKALHYQQLEQGLEYDYSYPGTKGHQFWRDMVYYNAALTFGGIRYVNVLINYDIYNNVLMYAMSNNELTKNVILDNNRVSYFEMDGEIFVNIRRSNGVLTAGIYQMPFDSDRIQLYAKLSKVRVANNSPEPRRHKFVLETTYILLLDEIAYLVRNKRDLQAAFASFPEAQRTLKKYKIKFNKEEALEIDLVAALKECENQLK